MQATGLFSYSHFQFRSMQDVQPGALQDLSSCSGHESVLITDSTNWARVNILQPSDQDFLVFQ